MTHMAMVYRRPVGVMRQSVKPQLASATLRRQPGGEIIAWGGANFAQALSRAGLVDEYVLVIQPVAFGSGLPLFAGLPHALRLELIEAKTFDSTVLHIYEPSDRATRPRA